MTSMEHVSVAFFQREPQDSMDFSFLALSTIYLLSKIDNPPHPPPPRHHHPEEFISTTLMWRYLPSSFTNPLLLSQFSQHIVSPSTSLCSALFSFSGSNPFFSGVFRFSSLLFSCSFSLWLTGHRDPGFFGFSGRRKTSFLNSTAFGHTLLFSFL